MVKAVLDTTVLVSAFLAGSANSPSTELLRFCEQGAFELYISEGILQELNNVLLNRKPIRRRYGYLDNDVAEYCDAFGRLARLVRRVPEVRGVVARDPNDDMIIACALAASADYVVTRDKDLLSLGHYQGIVVMSPEAFLHEVRALK